MQYKLVIDLCYLKISMVLSIMEYLNLFWDFMMKLDISEEILIWFSKECFMAIF